MPCRLWVRAPRSRVGKHADPVLARFLPRVCLADRGFDPVPRYSPPNQLHAVFAVQSDLFWIAVHSLVSLPSLLAQSGR